MGPGIGWPGPCPKGDPGGNPKPGPPNGWCPGDEKWGFPPPGGPLINWGPDELGLPINCDPPDGDPKGPCPGPLKGGPPELGGGPGKPEFGWGGPGVDDPDGAGEAVYCGVPDPGGGPP